MPGSVDEVNTPISVMCTKFPGRYTVPANVKYRPELGAVGIVESQDKLGTRIPPLGHKGPAEEREGGLGPANMKYRPELGAV